MLSNAGKRSRRNNLNFNLVLEDIPHIPTLCPILGIPLRQHVGKGASDNSPSLDRVKPALGYVRGNVVVISMRANRIKNNASFKEIVMIQEFYQELMLKSARSAR